MASEQYLEKAAYMLRRHRGDPKLDDELQALIAECQAELVRVGVPEERTMDEADPLILGAVRAFLRWKFPVQLEPGDAERLRSEFYLVAENLRKSNSKTQSSFAGT